MTGFLIELNVDVCWSLNVDVCWSNWHGMGTDNMVKNCHMVIRNGF
jgi:hypothetical protein